MWGDNYLYCYHTKLLCWKRTIIDGDVMVRVISCTWMDPFYFCRCRKREEVIQPHLFRGVHVSYSNYNNKSVAYMSCLVFRVGQRFKAEGCHGPSAMHSWYSGAPGNKFALASVVKESVRQWAVFGGLGYTVLGIFKNMYLGQDNN